MSFDCVHDIRGNSYCGQKLDVIGEIRLYDCVYDVHKSIWDISMYRTPLKCNGFSIVCATEGHKTFNIEWASGSSKRGQQGLNRQPSAAGPHNNGVVRIQCHTAEFGQSIRSACYGPHKWLTNAQQTINNVLSTRVRDDVKSTLHERGSWRYTARSQQINRNE